MALTKAIKEGLGLKGLMKDFCITRSILKIYCDNQNVIHLSKNPQYHLRTNPIDIKYLFIREEIENGEVEVMKVHTSENASDMLTNPVSKLKFFRCCELIGFHLLEN